jgi:outer membrane protein OmpA-like peptidoglycan-associated protein
MDQDKDGVADYLDKCLRTVAGEIVDTTGCPDPRFAKGSKSVLTGIVFAPGRPDIDSASNPVLAKLAATLKRAPKAKIEIAGFTDNKGVAKASQILSTKRAEAVVNQLVRLGVPAQQLAAKGYGPAQPIADNKSEAGRAKNNRIELRIK